MAKATTNKAKDTKKRSRRSRRKNRSLPYIVGGVGVLLLIFLPVIVNALRSGSLPGESFASQGNTHIELGDAHPAYNSDPPTSGWHTGDLISWGSYDYVVPEERVIHNMEDGGVLLWYRLGTPEENEVHVEALEELSSRFRRIVILPHEDMPTTYAFTAWQRLQRFDEIDEEGMLAFIEAFEGLDHHARF